MPVPLKRLLGSKGVRLVSLFVLYFFDWVWEKDDDLVVFTGLEGRWYTDNSRYLFEDFVRKRSDKLRIVWVTRNDKLIEEMNSKPEYQGRFVHQYSAEGVITLLRARTVINCFWTYDLPLLFSRRTTTVQLWHGIPIKAIGLQEKRFVGRSRKLLYKLWMESQYTYWVASSEADKRTTMLCTELPEDRVIVAGYPRNDTLVRQRDRPDGKALEKLPCLSKTTILYAPTWRTKAVVKIFPFENLDLSQLDALLEEFDAHLLLRGHYVDDVRMRNGSIDYDGLSSERVHLANRDLFDDVQELLPHVDVLISDYSGIWVDYLLLERPIIFIPYDLEDYTKETGLMYDYDEITPGPKVKGFQEFMDALRAYLSEPSKDADERARVKKMFHEHDDGKACERLFEFVSKKTR